MHHDVKGHRWGRQKSQSTNVILTLSHVAFAMAGGQIGKHGKPRSGKPGCRRRRFAAAPSKSRNAGVSISCRYPFMEGTCGEAWPHVPLVPRLDLDPFHLNLSCCMWLERTRFAHSRPSQHFGRGTSGASEPAKPAWGLAER